MFNEMGIRMGRYSAVYFWRAKEIIESQSQFKNPPNVLMQVFQKKRAVLCGVKEVVRCIKYCSGRWKDYDRAQKIYKNYLNTVSLLNNVYLNSSNSTKKITNAMSAFIKELQNLWIDEHRSIRLSVLEDGSIIDPWESVINIEGKYSSFSHLESVYLGILARSTKIATNTRSVVEAAGSKPVLFFGDRFDRYENQESDGYAALVGGASGICTQSMGERLNRPPVGTIPHALIACFNGDDVSATEAFSTQYPDVDTIALVDFHNDCCKSAVDTAKRFRENGIEIYGVRLDTSENMVDHSLLNDMGGFRPNGVCKELVLKVRDSLDKEGFSNVKIIVSGGFNSIKIREFEDNHIPVDAYGVGSSILEGKYDFTADIVKVNNSPMSKTGRKYNENKKLKILKWSKRN